MALNLSTLTSPANSSVLEEVNTTADFLEPCPVLKNLSRGSNKGGDAKQDVALNQPKALPLIKNPSGNLGGYLYIPDVSGNYATGPSVTIGANETWEAEVDMVITQFGNYFMPMGGGDYNSGFGLLIYSDGAIRSFSKNIASSYSASGITLGTSVNIKYGYGAIGLYVKINDVIVSQNPNHNQSSSITTTLQLAQQNNLSHSGNFAIQKAKLTVNSAVVFDCDFNGSTSIRHGDTKWQASVGGPVSLTKAGNDPVTVVKKSVLRFANKSDDSTNISLSGLLNQTVTGGYMFAAFSVLGDGGESYGRILGLNATGGGDNNAGGVAFRRNGTTTGLMLRYNAANITTHSNLFDDERGDYLLDVKVQSGSQQSKANNADLVTGSVAGQLNAEEFSVASFTNGIANNPAIDLEFLALFSADSVPDEATASKIRNYINNRNNVFDLKDGFGYYFFDAQKAPVGNISSGSSSWNGRIVGSDFGDSDRYLTQGTTNDAPVGDGFKVTFADNTDHLEIPQVTQAGWQVVGTSLGTFAYRVNNTAVTELNLLGNHGSASYRKSGDLYGIILLPESATGADIEAARRLLIDRGAADGTTDSSLDTYWFYRSDIIEFKHINTSSVTYSSYAFFSCQLLEKFPALDLSNSNNFTASWQNCYALTSFPADAKLGTAASSGVNFSSAWKQSGLTSFSTPLPTATTVTSTWQQCTSLTSFSTELPTATRVDYAWWGDNSLSDFRTTDIKNCTNFTSAWQGCSALSSFPADAKLGTAASNVNFTSAFQSSGLTSFSTPLPTATNVYSSWKLCSSLTSFNSELPLVTSAINAWNNCTSLASFSTELPSATNVSYAWYNCSSLASFSSELPSATNVSYAWQNCTSLESFSTDLPSATNALQAWVNCSSLTSFSTALPSVNNTSYAWYNCTSLESFSTELPSVTNASVAWLNCTSLSDFSADVFANWNPSSITSGVFNLTWDGCTSLTAQSVENILVSIDASGHYATTNKLQGGTALGDAGIDIDYNTATGSLSAATNAAITSLKAKGWSIIVNNVTL
ncbi:leucine-rich repeat protein [Akkermansiaceae bacterium]|nr:leucine-rich repeat protein [Akkermansiaceae bacterium]